MTKAFEWAQLLYRAGVGKVPGRRAARRGRIARREVSLDGGVDARRARVTLDRAPPVPTSMMLRADSHPLLRAVREASFLFAAAAASTLVSCASRDTEPPVADRAMASDAAVRVVNNTSIDVAVDVDGQALGDVAAGREQVFAGLEPGTHDLRGVSVDGALTFRRELLPLDAGETFTWVLREGGGGPAQDAAVVAGEGEDAVIVVENGTAWDVEVLLNGQVLGTAAAGRSAPFAGIVPGSYRLEARSDEATFPREYPILEAGETFTWRLRAPEGTELTGSGGLLPAPGTGRLRVENPHPVALTVIADGTALGTVEAQRVRIFDELPAQRMLLSAETKDRTRRVPGPSTRIEPGRVTEWRIGTLETTDVRAVEPDPVFDEDEEDVVIEDLPPRDDFPDEDAEPPVEPPGAGEADVAGERTFVVENGTPQDLQVFADDRVIGSVGAGMTERFSDLPALRFTPRAEAANGSRRYTHPEVDLRERASFTWIILP